MDFSNVQWLDIVNRSLAMISSSMLTKMDEGTSESNYVTVLLPQAVEEVYSSLPLDDISRYEELPRLADGSQNGSLFMYSYKVPSSCAYIRQVVLDGERERWQLIEGAILTDSESVSIRYIPLPSEPNDIPYYARALISVLLASRLAGPIAHNETLANLLRSQYESQLSRALTLSGKHREQLPYALTGFYSEDREC